MCWIETVRHIRRVVKKRFGGITISYQVVEKYIVKASAPVQRVWALSVGLLRGTRSQEAASFA